MTMWHGGAPGREIGDLLLPPDDTGFSPTNAQLTGRPARGKRLSYRSNLVYATTDREFAELFAQLYSQDPSRPGEGLVYEVELDSPSVDADFAADGRCLEARQGRIVGDGVPVSSSPARLARVLEEYKQRGALANEQRAARTKARQKRAQVKRGRASARAARSKKK